MPILNEILTDHWKLTGSPQTLPLTQHSLHNIKMHTMMSVPFYHINGTTYFLGGWSNTTPHTITNHSQAN